MGAVTVLRPNGDWSSWANSPLGGPGTYWQAFSDNSDSTYAIWFGSAGSHVECSMGNIAALGSKRIARVRAGFRGQRFNNSLNVDSNLYIHDGTSQSASTYYFVNQNGGGMATLYGSWLTTKPSGGEWTEAAANALRVRLEEGGGGATAPEVAEYYAEVDIRTQPTVSIITPTAGQRVFSQQPTVTWTYNAQGDTISRHRVKVFTAAVVGGGGFDPETSSAVYDSGNVAGAATSKQCTATLAYGGSYYFYVKTATDFNGADWWSAWASRQFYVNSPPTVSNVTTTPATPITTTNKPDIEFDYDDVDGESSEYVQVKVFSEAQYDAGGFDPGTSSATWDSGATNLTVASGASGSVTVGQGLSSNTNFKAHVRAAEVGSGQRWSGWAASGVFVIQTAPGLLLDPPAAPEATSVAADNDNLRVVVQVEGRDNLLTRNQSTIDTGTTGWEVDTNCALARNTTDAFQGGGCLEMTASGAGDMKARTVGDAVLPVNAGSVYTAQGRFKAGSTGRTVQILVNWFDSGPAYLSTSATAGQADTTGSYVLEKGDVTAPANAVWAQVIPTVLAAGAAEVHFVDNVGLQSGSDQTWVRGGFVGNYGRLTDGFNRADSTTSLGTADEGGAWTAHTGTWGINGNRGYLDTAASPTDAVATLQSTHLADGAIEADITLSAARANAGLVFRAADDQDFLMVRLRKTTVDAIELYKRSGGTYTLLADLDPAGLTLGATYHLRVEFHGGQLRALLDGVERLSHLLLVGDHDEFGSYDRYGLYLGYDSSNPGFDDGATRFDNLVAELAATQTVDLERSLDDGATWEAVRDATGMVLSNQIITVNDYEVPPGVLAQYRAMSHAGEQDETFSSEWGVATVQDTELVADGWWLKDPLDPSVNQRVAVAPPFDFRRKEPQAIYEPLGRTTAVVVTDGPRGIEGTLTLWAKDAATYTALDALLRLGHPLLLVDPFARQWYIKVGSTHDWFLLRAQPTPGENTPIRHLHAVSVRFTEVAAPA